MCLTLCCPDDASTADATTGGLLTEAATRMQEVLSGVLAALRLSEEVRLTD